MYMVQYILYDQMETGFNWEQMQQAEQINKTFSMWCDGG